MNIRKQSDRANLRREIILHKPHLVCMGPVYKIARRRGNENYEDAADEAMAILDDLRIRYGFALVLEAHAAKGSQGAKRQMDPMGSQRYLAWPEVGISLYQDDNVPNGLIVQRFRGDRIPGLNWPSQLYRDPVFSVQGRFENGI